MDAGLDRAQLIFASRILDSGQSPLDSLAAIGGSGHAPPSPSTALVLYEDPPDPHAEIKWTRGERACFLTLSAHAFLPCPSAL